MYDTSMRELLAMPHLLGSYTSRAQPRQFMLTEAFYTNPEPVPGDDYDLIHWPQMQEPVPGNVPSSEARILAVGDGTRRRVSLFYTFNKATLPGVVLEALSADSQPTLNRMASEAIGKIQTDFGLRHQIFKECVIGQIFSFGRVNMDGQGNMLVPSVDATTGAVTDASGTILSCDMEMEDDHRGNLDGIIAASWATAGTKIADHLDAIKIAAEEAGTEEPTEIWVHPINKKHLRNNTQFETWAKENQVNADAVLRGNMIEDLWGFNWHFYGGTYKLPNSTTKVPYLNKKVAAVCPAGGNPWISATAGVNRVPSSIDIATSLDEAIGNLVEVPGQFSFARVSFDPACAFMYMGDKFGLHLGDPNALWLASAFPGT